MHFYAPLGVAALLVAAQAALAAPSALSHESVVKRSPSSVGPKRDYPDPYGPASNAEAAVPVNPQSATTACPVYANQTIEIPVFVYMPYYQKKTWYNNYFTTAELMKGINSLNRAYGKYSPRIKFKLQTPKYKLITSPQEWEAMQYSTSGYINKKLTIPARGPLSKRGANQMRELWLYMVPGILDYNVGFSFIPVDKNPFEHDGVFFDSESWDGFQATLVQQVGHWLRLEKVFRGGCKGTDFVGDTPPWKLDWDEPGTLRCKGSDGYSYEGIYNICGGSKGDAIKNIRNFMSNSDDHCRTELTWGQRKRYWDTAVNWRKFKPVCGPVK
ncbi:hypothetical protein OIV83_005620 [Microbotryomycetes sp. JL201]|nr:hypothetical protein OIV83_005620 [Microbotryomycetes sp. JL201]